MNIFEVMKEEKKYHSPRRIKRDLDDLLEKIKRSRRGHAYKRTACLFLEAAARARMIEDPRTVEFYINSAQESMKAGDSYNAAWAYRNAALCSFEMGDFGKAADLSEESAGLFEKTKTHYGMQWCYKIMAECFENLGKIPEAIKYYKKSMGIEKDEGTEEKVKALKEKFPDVSVKQRCAKHCIREGENVEFELGVKNLSKERTTHIRALGKDSKILDSIGELEPNGIHVFRSKSRAGKKEARSPFTGLVWNNPAGEEFSKDIEHMAVRTSPNVHLNAYFKGELKVGKQSFFVVFVKNDSGSEIGNVRLHIHFPVEIKVKPITGYSMEKIGPGEEKGFVFKVLPTALERVMLKPSITYELEGKNHDEEIEPFLMKDALEIPGDKDAGNGKLKSVDRKTLERMKKIREQKRYLVSLFAPEEMNEVDFIDSEKVMASVKKGFSLKNTGMKDVLPVIREELKGMYMVSSRSYEDSSLLMYSCKTKSSGETYLLKVVVKEEGGLVFVALSMFSEKGEELEDIISKISRIIEHSINAMTMATEVENVEVKETINIIDSVVQRSEIGGKEKSKDKKIKLKDSVVQKTGL